MSKTIVANISQRIKKNGPLKNIQLQNFVNVNKKNNAIVSFIKRINLGDLIQTIPTIHFSSEEKPKNDLVFVYLDEQRGAFQIYRDKDKKEINWDKFFSDKNYKEDIIQQSSKISLEQLMRESKKALLSLVNLKSLTSPLYYFFTKTFHFVISLFFPNYLSTILQVLLEDVAPPVLENSFNVIYKIYTQ